MFVIVCVKLDNTLMIPLQPASRSKARVRTKEKNREQPVLSVSHEVKRETKKQIIEENWVSWSNGTRAQCNSQSGSREVEVVPEVFVIINDAAHQVQQWLALHLSSDAMEPGPKS